MKINKKQLMMIISTVLICIPTQIFAWLQYSTYEVSNTINTGIAWFLKAVAFIIVISYITGAIQHIKHSKQSSKQKMKNILTWLIVVIVEVTFCLGGAIWVEEMGMETYWSSGERYQFNEIDGYISNGLRIMALVLIIAFIIRAIVYFAKSKEDNLIKIEKLIKWQVIMASVVAILLIFATRW